MLNNWKLWIVICCIVMLTPSCYADTSGVCDGRNGTFNVYDNLDYVNRPKLADYGVSESNVLYQEHIWPQHTSHKNLPDQAWYVEMVRKRVVHSGPVVVDVEDLPIGGTDEAEVRENVRILSTLADWTRDAVPTREIGFYSYNVLPDVPDTNVPWVKPLLDRIDSFFVGMYSLNDDRQAWVARANHMVERARTLAPNKKIYFYLWPQYLERARQSEQFIDVETWKFVLTQSCLLADGIVLWSKHVPMTSSDWIDPVLRMSRGPKSIVLKRAGALRSREE